MGQKIALITGASRGIGAAFAKNRAKAGYHILLLARSVTALEAVHDDIASQGGSATIIPTDLTKHDQIDRLGGEIAERYGKLDLLIGNAGLLGGLSPLPHIDPDIWQKVFDVNVTANYRLLRSMDPLLRKAQGIALFISSGITKEIVPYWGLYGASKAALEYMVLTYQKEVAHSGVQVKLAGPGITATNMRAQAMPGEDPLALQKPEEAVERMIADLDQ